MIDPACFAGRATHYRTRMITDTIPDVACGQSAPKERTTDNPHWRRVTCLRCRKTHAWRRAWDALTPEQRRNLVG